MRNSKKIIPEKHIFRYYANRKIYDTETKKLSNHKGILKSIKKGREILVIYNETESDITHNVLFQILIEEMEEPPEFIAKLLHSLLFKDPNTLKQIHDFVEKIAHFSQKLK